MGASNLFKWVQIILDGKRYVARCTAEICSGKRVEKLLTLAFTGHIEGRR